MRRAAAAAAALATAGVLGVGAVAVGAPPGGNDGGGWRARAGGPAAERSATEGTGNGPAWAGAGRWGGQGRGAGWGAGWGAGGGHGAGQDVPAPVPGATISDEVADILAFMVQEEKLAHDMYQLAAGEYPDRVFANITRSEATHMSEVRTLLDRYDVVDPTREANPGEFADAGLQQLYDDLADQVGTSRDAAIQAGITIEQTDIADLEAALAQQAPADVDTVLGNLLAGSERHLAAFQRNA